MLFQIFLALLIIIMCLVIPIASVIIILIADMLFINLKTKVPWARIPETNLENILASLKLPQGALVYDLGCGDGRFLFLAEKYGLKAIGYELAYYPYLKALISKFIKGSKVMIENKDFFKADLSEAKAVFIFLTASVMEKIGTKLKQNLKAGTTVISYGFLIPDWPILKTLETKPSRTYIYLTAD